MARIKNMGTATMRFGEGVIVSGSAVHPNGTSSNYALIVSGDIYGDEDLILERNIYLSDSSYTSPTIYFNDANSVYIQEINNQLIIESNNFLNIRFDQGLLINAESENNPIFQFQNKGYTIKGAFFNVSQDSDQNFGISTANRGKTFFVSASDDTVMFHAGGLPPAPSDTSTWFSGSAYNLSAGFFDPSNFGEATGRITQFSGDVVTSGAIVGKNNSLLGITGEENCLILAAKNSIYSSAGSYGFYSDISNLQNIGNDAYFFVSGAIGGRGQEGTAVFGGDVVTSGSLSVGAITIPNTDGTNGQVLKTDGSGSLTWQDGTASAAGSNTQIQYNTSGSLGASANLTFDGSTLGINGDIEHDNYSQILYPTNMSNTGSYAKQKAFIKELFYVKYNWSGTSYTDLFTIEPYDDRTELPYTGSIIWAVVGIECTLTGHRRFVGNTFTKNYMVLDWAAGTTRSYNEYTGVRIGANPDVWFDADTSVNTNGIKLRFKYNDSSVGNANLHFVINAGYPIDDLSAGADGKHIYWVLTEHFSGSSE